LQLETVFGGRTTLGGALFAPPKAFGASGSPPKIENEDEFEDD